MIDTETVAQASEGDAVRVGLSFQSWVEPMDVLDVAVTEWDVPFGEDWLTAEVALQADRKCYVAIADSHSDLDPGLYKGDGDGGVGERYAPLREFEIVETVDESPGDAAPTEPSQPFQDYSASRTTKRTCQNCGSHVQKDYARVFGDDGEVAVCENCPDKIREGDGTVREKKYTTGGVK